MQDAHPIRGTGGIIDSLYLSPVRQGGESVGGPALAQIEHVHRLEGQLARANERSSIAIETFALGCSM